jgi:hypothetical protein
LVRIVTMVDGAAVQEAWGLALKAAAGGDPASVLLMGSGLAPASELSATIAELRRKFRGSDAPIVVPVDVRDWTALVPTNAPAAVRMILEKLRKPA